MMKPAKSPRVGVPSRGRPSRNDPPSKSSSPATTPQGDNVEKETKENRRLPSTQPSEMEDAVSLTAVGQDTAGIEAMRRRMSEALAQKHQMMAATATINNARSKATDPSMPGLVHSDSAASDDSALEGTVSTDSTKTVRASATNTPGVVRTPSYPFPRMHFRLNRNTSHRSGPSHKPFTLLSPTNEPPEGVGSFPLPAPEVEPSEMSTPIGHTSVTSQNPPEDPNYPSPDLYDIILMLNAEPGLDNWWSNMTDILAESYGAERASLALPGDITDLENVPWGQKATFNTCGSDSAGVSALDSAVTSDVDLKSIEKIPPVSRTTTDNHLSSQRPPLQSRHSIGGVLPEQSSRPRQRPAPIRAISSLTPHHEEDSPHFDPPKLTRQAPTPRTQSNFIIPMPDGTKRAIPDSVSTSLRCHVYKALQPLEQEADSLLVRTGVSDLFGKRRPVFITRTYADQQSMRSPGPYSTFGTEPPRSAAPSTVGDKTTMRPPTERATTMDNPFRSFEDHEQPEPSPWSQSPAPSPAARPDPTESPFFVQKPAATIDESAFEQNAPAYDYGASANVAQNAIGNDMSKTLVHVPLIQPVPARGALASTLRFPIAILSFLSPIDPYPVTFRRSLMNLLPHLASSYSLAQQYSNLQDRIRGAAGPRHGAVFGLGGTFSDEGSEMELVAELSGQLAHEKAKAALQVRQDTSRLSSEQAPPVFRESPDSSIAGTPLHEHLGFSPGLATTPGRSGADMVEGYFSAKRQKGGSKAMTPGGRNTLEETRDRPEAPVSLEKSAGSTKPLNRKSGVARSLAELPPLSPRPGSQTSESEYGDVAGSFESGFRKTSRSSISKDDGEKPLPELISSLMLNAVPLQLFLAKPGKGELVWTNRKFDAFRSQGEGRVRDPWKNVHDDDRTGLVKLWQEALKTGSQFTHYIRVKRFNSDSDFRWFVFRASTLLTNTGRLLYWIGSFLDVHEQYIKNLEASEREASIARDAKIRALADAIPQILFEAVESEGIMAVNQQWHAYSGQTLEEARGLGFAKHVHREDLHKCGILSSSEANAIARASNHSSDSGSSSSSNRTAHPPVQKNLFAPDASSLNQMIKHGSVTVEKDENQRLSYLTEIRLRSKGGEYRWFLVRLSRVHSGLLNTGRASWYGTCTDIEIRKALERELNQANEKVHSEMESKTKFFANMSHEIRTPLNGILGSMPWLVESTLDHEQRRTVDTIQNSANNLRELVDNILDVTKVEAGKMTLVPKWFHVRSLCEEVVDTVSSRAIERGLELNYALDADVPTTVKGDPFRVRQILLNLLGNSVKFTEQGEVYMGCSVKEDLSSTADHPKALLNFTVVDTGRGFNEADFQRLFKQFGQIGSGTNHDAGSGLGLFLSKQLVEMHGGELSVKSQAGEGSTFSFFIRVEISPPGETPNSPPAASRAARHRQSSSMSESSRSRSDSKTPTIAKPSEGGAIIQTPGLSRYVSSPETQSPSVAPSTVTSPNAIASPPVASTVGSWPSARSSSVSNIVTASSQSSLVRTPDSQLGKETEAGQNERQIMMEKVSALYPALRRSKSDNDGTGLAPEAAHPATYSIVVICPAEHARLAIKQHIEHVVPLQIPVNVTTLGDIGSFLELMNGPASPSFTHIVLDLPASSDIMLFMRQMANFTAPVIPALVVVTDHYQKRDIQEDFQTLVGSGRKAYLIHKPVKPSVFAMIFDPAQLRNLSRDRQREVAQTQGENFRQMAETVKTAIGNRTHRVLLVEDSDVNRMVILRYLKKVELENDSAKDGQECVDAVLGKGAGHYDLIICDIQMPRKNGYEACQEIREWERLRGLKPVPIMALTANAMPEERMAASAAGFTDYLTKPVDFNVLGGMMMRLLDPRMEHVFLRDRPVEG